LPKQEPIAFGAFTLYKLDESLWKGSTRIPLRPKSFALLLYLVEHSGCLVTKDQLLGVLWPDCRVGEGALKRLISEIRSALHDSADTPKWIETAHRRGYRFIGHVDRMQLPAEPVDTPMQVSERPEVGGDPAGGSEFTLVHRLLEKAQRGMRQIVFISGEQGTGKTALVDAFLERIDPARNGIRVARGLCIQSHGSSEAYMPFLESLTMLCNRSERRQIVSILQKNAPLWLLQMPSVVSKMQLRTLREITLGSKQSRMLREMAEALEVLCAEVPLILVLEDLHWSDSATLDLISYLAQRRGCARLLLIATYRPAEAGKGHLLNSVVEKVKAHQQCHELALCALDVGRGELEWQKRNEMQAKEPAPDERAKPTIQ
jgi:DNA-binding winged helix-turn-helix (wHTH) protein